MFLIKFEKANNNKEIYNITTICNTLIKIEPSLNHQY